MPVVTPWRASTDIVNAVPSGGPPAGAAIIGRLRRPMVSSRERDADEPAPVHGHEVHGVGRDELGRHREVALVLAVLVVDEMTIFPARMSAMAPFTRSRSFGSMLSVGGIRGLQTRETIEEAQVGRRFLPSASRSRAT